MFWPVMSTYAPCTAKFMGTSILVEVSVDPPLITSVSDGSPSWNVVIGVMSMHSYSSAMVKGRKKSAKRAMEKRKILADFIFEFSIQAPY